MWRPPFRYLSSWEEGAVLNGSVKMGENVKGPLARKPNASGTRPADTAPSPVAAAS